MGLTQSVFLQAAADGDALTVRKMVKADPRLIRAEDEHGWTALHTASSNGHVIVVRELLQQGACVYEADSSGFTALHYACWNESAQNHEVMNELINGGAEVNCRSTSGITPLHLAVTYSRTKIVTALLTQHGAYSDIATDQGNTPFHVACKEGLLEMVKLLHQHDSSLLNRKNKNGDTPLHLVSANGHGDVALFLLEQNGIDMHVRNNEGVLPFATKASFIELVGKSVIALLEKDKSKTGDYQALPWQDTVDDLVLEEDLALEEFQQTLMSYV